MWFSHLSQPKVKFLKNMAGQIRLDILQMIAQAGSGHPAGSLGMADIFTTLYFHTLHHNPRQPQWVERDYLLLSNGHICPVLYASLAHSGYFDTKLLSNLRQLNSPLEGHPHLGALPGIENSSGPLGQGISQAAGLALALKRDNKYNRVYCVMSDGEQQEGQTWEAYQFASKYQLGNFTIIIDRNNIQIGGKTNQVMPLEPFEDKLKGFGLLTITIDGHNFNQIAKALEINHPEQPLAIIAQTVPGKGVSFMEHDYTWHGKAPSNEELELAIAELNQTYEQL